MKILVAATLAGLTLLPAAALSQSSLGDGAEEAEVNAATRVICRRVPAPTGSRIGSRRICRTQMAWDRIEQEARDAMEEAGNRNRMDNEGANLSCGAMARNC